MTPEEIATIKRRAHARRLRARQVERARIIWLTRHGWGMPAIAKELPLTQVSVRSWLKRFTAQGLAGLEDQPWSDQPVMSRPAQVVEVIATALTDPQHLGWPFALWMLDCLETDLNEEKGIAIKRSRIDDLLLREGLRWRTQESWFGERRDPDFAKKRGLLSGSTLPLRRAV